MGNVSSAVEGYMPFLKTFPKLLSLWGWGVSEIYIHTVARPNCDLKKCAVGCRSGVNSAVVSTKLRTGVIGDTWRGQFHPPAFRAMLARHDSLNLARIARDSRHTCRLSQPSNSLLASV